MKWRNPYHYLFYFTYHNIARLNNPQPVEASILILSSTGGLLAMPLLARTLVAEAGRRFGMVFGLVLVAIMLLLYFINTAHFRNEKVRQKIYERFEHCSAAQLFTGRIIAWLIFLASTVCYFVLFDKLLEDYSQSY